MTDQAQPPTGIAIIGLSGRFPGAKQIEDFWRNLQQGVESITFFDQPAQLPFGQDRSLLDAPNYVRAEPVLAEIDLFDAAFFGFTPREAEVLDPQQRLFLECSWEALELAGYDPEAYPGAIGVFGGMFMSTYLLNNLLFNRKLLQSVGELAVRHGNDKDYLATRVSYKLNLRGPSVAVQTSCSTSLVSVHLACQSLLNGECDMALAGGASISVPQQAGYAYHEGSILSPDGHCRAFDKDAQGTIFGSGVGVVVLKRLQDALDDGDYIHAVIRSSAMNNDGSSKVGYTAPSVNGQRAVIAEALALAEVDPETIGYVEAHGTGTPLGDPIEIAALTQAYRDFTDKTQFCAIGALKTNIGHLGAAAGVAGLIKTTLALGHGQIPPSLNFLTPNPQIDFASSPFYVNTALRDWPSTGGPRRAGLSSFGMGGTNVHAILEQAPVVSAQPSTRPSHLLLLSARSGPALDAMTINLLAHLRSQPELNLADVAATLQRSRRAFSERRALICSDVADAIAALETLDPRRVFSASASSEPRPVVFMFPGQGAQYVNMARGLYEHEPVFRGELDRCCALLRPQLGLDLRTLLFVSPEQAEAIAPQLQQTRVAQSALFVIEYALAQLWLSWGIRPVAMIGHSIGEYVAATLAGVLTLEDALQLVAARGRLMQATAPGTMLSVQLAEAALLAQLPSSLSLAAVNGPALCVVSGPTDAIEQFERQLGAQGVEHRRLHTSHAFHSALMEPILQEFGALLRRIRLSPPELPYISNVSGSWITPAQATDPAYWVQHLRSTVRFADGMRELLSADGAILLEVGPGQTLSALARQQLQPGMTTQALASLRHPREQQPDLAFILATLGKLWLAGVPVDWAQLYAGERRLRLPLPTYPFQRQRYWIDPPQQGQIFDLGPAAVSRSADLADWFYSPAWQRATLVGGFKPERDRCWLLFVDPRGASAELAERLIEQLSAHEQPFVVVQPGQQFARPAEDRYTLRPTVPADYAALLDDLRSTERMPTRLLHLWGVGVDGMQQDAPLGLLLLTQALRRQLADTPLQLQIVTSQAQQLGDDEPIDPAGRALLGLCAPQPLAAPQLRCRSVDVVLPTTGGRAVRQLAAQLLAELRADGDDRVIALRRSARWVQRFEALRLPAAETAPLRDGGVYLLDGGLSPRGLLLAEYLARAARATLVLTADTPFPPRATWDELLSRPDLSPELSAPLRALRELEALGAQVLVRDLDRSRPAAIRALLSEIDTQHGQLDGVIYLAADAPPQPLDTIEPDDWRAQTELALARIVALDEALGGRALDLRLVIDGGAALLGGSDAAIQAAIAEILAGYAQQSSPSDAPWRCVSWCEAAPPAELAPSAAEGAEALRRILALDASTAVAHVVVSTADLAARLAQARQAQPDKPDATAARVDGAALHLRPNLPTAYVAPRTPTEQALIAIWQEAFGIGQVGVHDNFFDLGGHSLLATQLVARLRSLLQIELPMRALFEAPTVAELAQQIDAGRAPHDAQSAPIQPIARDGELALSFAQQRLWFLSQLETDSATYNIPAVVRLSGRLDVTALERSLNAVVARHEALRTSFAVVAGQPVQVIAPSLHVALPLIDLQTYADDAQQREAQRLITAEIQQPFDLQHGPLLRAAALRLSRQEHIVVFVVHHIAADGWSINVLVRELAALYETISAGRPVASAPLPALPVQYADWAHWQRHWLSGALLEQQVSYWRQQLGPRPAVLDLPTDRPRPPLQSFRGAKQSVQLSPALTEALKQLSQREGVTLFMTLLAAWQTLLQRYSGDEQIIVGTPIANRSRSELEGLIGVFANTLVLNTDFSGDPSFRALLGRVRETALGAYAHQDLPFEQLVEALQLERDLSRNPLFQVLFSLQQAAEPLALPDLTLSLVEVDSQTARFDLTLSMIETPGGLVGTLEYNTDLFFDATATRMLAQFETLLAAIVADAERPLSTLPLLSAEARRQLIIGWNQTRRDYPRSRCVHQLVEAQAARTPAAVAAIYGDEQLSYAELNRRANQLAHHLQALGVGPQSRVAIFVDRSLTMLVALLGVLKSGAAYIPLDPIYPPERLQYMLTDAAVPVVLTETELVASLPAHSAQLVRLDADWPLIAQQPGDNPAAALSPDDLAYIIYTSGSTGQPKGVMIPHRAVVNFLTTMAEQPGLSADDVLLAVTTLSFDIAGLELFLPLSVGARVVIASRASTTDGAQLARLIDEAGVSVMQATPVTWRLLIEAGWRDQGRVKVLCGGEAVPRELANELLRRGVAEFWNVYGPTETTIWSSVFRVLPGDGPLPIGRPIANTQLYVLDRQLEPTPIGVPGELYIGGDGLARGYLNRPALTAEKFVPDPWSDQARARLYRTGDLVRWLPDGSIEFLRRIDHQIKLRGFRIELGEIEAALLAHPAIEAAAVVVREERLVAYVVEGEPRTNGTTEQPTDHRPPTTDSLRDFLKQRLPEYMLPGIFVRLDALPLTPNGKLDRKALPAPETLDATARLDAGRELAAPRTPVEQQIAAIWRELLRVERVGVDDNFFALGGHSLLVTRLLFKLRDTFAIELPLRALFEAPTVVELARAVEAATRSGHVAETSEMTVDTLRAEVALDPAIGAAGLSALPAHAPQQILLTGATGFLGAFLLRELIERTGATITCLVRAASPEEGLGRIRRNLAAYGIWHEQLSARIVPLVGDLAQPLLGLSSEQFAALARRIDAIYHNGAFVNFIYPYAALKAANVLGTQEVLRLASQATLKPVYFVSTHSTLPLYAQIAAVEAGHPAAQQAVHYTGYIQSKWVAEQLVLLARERGLPVAIFRPGRISGASDTGACQTNDFLWRMIKACIQVGLAPDLDLRLDMTPVEHVARSIVDLAHEAAAPADANLVNPAPIHLRRLVDWMRALGYGIELVGYDTWRDALAAAAQRSTDNAAYELVPFLTSQNASEDEMAHQVTDLDQAQAELPLQLGPWPALDDRLLATYFGYFIQSGYLDAPTLPDPDLLDEDEHIVFDI